MLLHIGCFEEEERPKSAGKRLSCRGNGLKVVKQALPFSQTLCFAISLLFARDFARERLDPVECCLQWPESQEQAELSPPCVTPEVQGWSHLDLIAGILVGLIVGCLWQFSLQLAVANEVSVTNGGDSTGEAAHRRRRGQPCPELEAFSSTWKTTAGLKGCWCRGSGSLCAPRTRGLTRSSSLL